MKLIKRPGLTPVKESLASIEADITNRADYIGGSDAGALLGLNEYKSPYTLWAEKVGIVSDYVEDNDAMRTGRDLEEYVAKRFCEATGKNVRKSSKRYSLAEYPYMAAHIDREIVGENAILECKTANSFKNSVYGAGKYPDHYYAQCVHYMAVTGAERCYLAVLCFPHFYYFTIERNEEEISALIEAEKNFWELVQNGTPPEIDGSESTERTLSAQFMYDPENMPENFETLLSDEDFNKAESVNSNTQLYKQAGNSIVKDVLVSIFKELI